MVGGEAQNARGMGEVSTVFLCHEELEEGPAADSLDSSDRSSSRGSNETQLQS